MRYFSMAIGCVLGVITLAMPNTTFAEDAKSTVLFDGKDLSGWTPYIWDRDAGKQDTTAAMSVVWTVKDAILICKGRPTGYLRTKAEFENYQLTFEWRWPADTGRGNSGVLVHTTTPNALGQWPKSVEVQLYTRHAGDFWVIGTDLDVEDEAERKRGRRYVNLTDGSEKPFGEWNKMEITCQGNEITVKVNGDLVNHATNCTVTKGAIALQSEGAEVHYRNIVLSQLSD